MKTIFKLSLATMAFIVVVCAAPVDSEAAVFDLSGITLSGSYPNYSFNNSDLGNVNIDYTSPNAGSGIYTQWGGVNTLFTGGETTLSWDNAVTSLEFRLYDLDLGEYTDFTLPAGTSLSVIESLNGSTLNAGGTRVNGVSSDLFNASATNYIALQLSGNPFTSVSVFTRRGTSALYGSAGIGFGDPQIAATDTHTVPEPATMALFGTGLAGAFIRRKFIG